MPRRTFDAIVSWVGVLMVGVLLVAGTLMYVGYSFADDNVREQLSAQKIFFPPVGPALEDPAIKPYLTKYAGQQLVDGAQAEAYANHFIAVHIAASSGGKTYAELGALVRANPKDATIAATRETVFKGETLRGLLLQAYAFWKIGQLAKIGAIVAFATAGLMAILTLLGFAHLRKVSPIEQILAPDIERGRRTA